MHVAIKLAFGLAFSCPVGLLEKRGVRSNLILGEEGECGSLFHDYLFQLVAKWWGKSVVSCAYERLKLMGNMTQCAI